MPVLFAPGSRALGISLTGAQESHGAVEELAILDTAQALVIEPVHDEGVIGTDEAKSVLLLSLVGELCWRHIKGYAAVHLLFAVEAAEVVGECLAKRCHLGALGEHSPWHLPPSVLLRIQPESPGW